MLRKLMKHEWLESWKVPTFLIGLLLAISVLAGFTFALPVWESEMNGLTVLMILVWMLYYCVLIVVSVGVMIYLAVRFYKTMFTDEGYLTHTLPVTARQLLLSKVLPMSAWSALTTVAIFLSVFIFMGMAMLFLGASNGVNMAEFTMEFKWAMEELFGVEKAGEFIFSIVLLVIVGTFSGVLMIVGSITIGQLVGKHKILGSVGAYCAINTVMQIVSVIAMFPSMFGNMMTAEENVFALLTPMYNIQSLISVVITIVLYFVSEMIIKRKLNLD